MQIFCYAPAACFDPKLELSEQIRAMLQQALNLGLEPAPLPRGLEGQPVRIDGDLLAQVVALSEQHGIAKGRVVGGLLYALHLQNGSAATKGAANASGSMLVPITEGLRSGQVRCLLEVAPSLRMGKVIAAECGTGTGKSRVIAHAVAYVLALRDSQCEPAQPLGLDDPKNPDAETIPPFIAQFATRAQSVVRERINLQTVQTARAVIVAAPSAENVSHLAREWEVVRHLLEHEAPITSAVVLGRGQFVSPSLLRAQLHDSEIGYPVIEDWLQAGMPPGQTSATRHLGGIEPLLCGLMADLEALAGDTALDLSSVGLDEDAPPEEHVTYQALRAKAFEVDVVWTTHAMLCLDSLRLAQEDSPPLLPPPLALFVDEAHLLEQSQAMMCAKSLSMVRLLRELQSPLWAALRRQGLARDVGSCAKELIQKLADMPNETPLPVSQSGDLSLIRMWDSAQPALRSLREAVTALVEGADKAKYAAHRAQFGKSLRYVRNCVLALEQIGKDFRGHIDHSPKRHSLSFNVGPSSVDKYLAARWATTPTVMFLSGMLHYIGVAGANYKTVHRELQVPSSRQASTIPMHPSWVTDTPILFTPAPTIFHRLMPPTGDEISELSMATWMAECAKVINLAASDAAGGMLVLMTGYDRLEVLAAAIEWQFPNLVDRVMVHSRRTRLATLANEFKERARAGLRPIWLATGSAWTGLDLADELIGDNEAAKDLILTDLVIPNLPFGLQRSTTHVARLARLGFRIEQIATQRTFRNGLGRGVRREGLTNRRYWVLDGRLQHPATASYTADLRRVLQMYLHRDTFVI